MQRLEQTSWVEISTSVSTDRLDSASWIEHKLSILWIVLNAASWIDCFESRFLVWPVLTDRLVSASWTELQLNIEMSWMQRLSWVEISTFNGLSHFCILNTLTFSQWNVLNASVLNGCVLCRDFYFKCSSCKYVLPSDFYFNILWKVLNAASWTEYLFQQLFLLVGRANV